MADSHDSVEHQDTLLSPLLQKAVLRYLKARNVCFKFPVCKFCDQVDSSLVYVTK